MSIAFALVDAHQHFWDPRHHYYPWLCDEPPIAFRYGDYRAIRRPYLPADYFSDSRAFTVSKTVYIEAEWNPSDPIGEMRYVDELRHATGFPSVAIAQAWLDRDDCASVLEQLAAFRFVRGIRHKPRANARADMAAAGGMSDAAWRAGFARLAPLGLHFELQTPWWHLADAARLARDFPATNIVLNHTGLPADRSQQAIAGWKTAMQRAASCPNISVKISGIGLAGQAWRADTNREVVLSTIELFGVDRCMFASNFPVDSLCASFDEIFNGFAQIVADFSEPQRRALFHDNALRIYRID